MPLKEALCSDMNYFMQITRFRVKIPPPGIALFYLVMNNVFGFLLKFEQKIIV